MHLSDYCGNERGTASKLAAAIGAPPPLVSQWATGIRPVPIERCVAIEHHTDGKVRRWDLRPDDWFRIWPELIDATGAPALPSATSNDSGAIVHSASYTGQDRRSGSDRRSGIDRRNANLISPAHSSESPPSPARGLPPPA